MASKIFSVTTLDPRNICLRSIAVILEGLWLLAVVLIPLAFVPPGTFITEAAIGHFEVPKVIILRIIAGLMAIFCFIEWAVKDFPIPFYTRDGSNSSQLLESTLKSARHWLNNNPTSWIVVAVCFFGITTMISTIFSASWPVSLWGEVPGQDGYSAYTVGAYLVLFGVIVTHIKTSPQILRLLVAISVIGSLVAGYAVCQHYQLDFLKLGEITGGGANKGTSFMGNSIFSATVMMMTFPITFSLVLVTLEKVRYDLWSFRSIIVQCARLLIPLGFGTSLITLQVIGLAVTMSRGPWIGGLAAISVFIVLVGFVSGKGTLLLSFVLSGLIGISGFLFLACKGSLPIVTLNPTIAFVVLSVSLIVALIVISTWAKLCKLYLSVAFIMLLLIVSLTFVTNIDSKLLELPNVTSGKPIDLLGRIGSVGNEVTSGSFSGRSTHWLVVWDLFRSQPWPAFDDLTFGWLRPLVGYGPDLFRYTYLLGSVPENVGCSPFCALPHEADHAHNFFIHHLLEQGILGFFSTISIFGSLAFCGFKVLSLSRLRVLNFELLTICGLIGILTGRLIEMLVGVARVSDLTLLWVLIAMVVVIPRLIVNKESTSNAAERGKVKNGNKSRRAFAFTRLRFLYTPRNIGKLVLVIIVVIGLTTFTWSHNVNYVHAGAEAATGVIKYNNGDLQSALTSFNNSTNLAPDVAVYHHFVAGVFAEYQSLSPSVQERGCMSQSNLSYDECLASKRLLSLSAAITERPLYYDNYTELAKFHYERGSYGKVTDYYEKALMLVPRSWIIRNKLAEAYLATGYAGRSVRLLEESVNITGDLTTAETYLLLGKAYLHNAEVVQAIDNLEAGLLLGLSDGMMINALDLFQRAYEDSSPELAIASLSRLITEDGLPDIGSNPMQLLEGVYESLPPELIAGLLERIILEKGVSRGVDHEEALAMLSDVYVSSDLDRVASRYEDLIRDIPGENYLITAYLGDYLRESGEYRSALELFNNVLKNTEEQPIVYHLERSLANRSRGDLYRALGSIDMAANDYEAYVFNNPGDAEVWLELGKVKLQLGNTREGIEALAKASELGSDAFASEESLEPFTQFALLDEPDVRNSEEAVNYYKEKLVLFPEDRFVRNQLAKAYLMAGDSGSVIKILNQPTSGISDLNQPTSGISDSNKVNTYLLLGEAYYQDDKYIPAVQALEKSLMYGASGIEMSRVFDLLGQLYTHINKDVTDESLNRIIVGYEDAVKVKSENDVMYNIGLSKALNQTGRYDDALEVSDYLISIADEEDTDLIYEGILGQIKDFHIRGDAVQAGRLFEWCLRQGSFFGFMYRSVGLLEGVYESLPPELIAGLLERIILEKGVSRGVDHEEALAMLSDVYVSSDLDRVASRYEDLIRDIPGENYLITAYLGDYLRESGEYRSALELFNSVLKDTEEQPIRFHLERSLANRSRGDLYRELGSIDMAANDYEAYVFNNPGDAEVWLELGKVKLQLGNTREGIEALAKASELGNGEASALLSNLIVDD